MSDTIDLTVVYAMHGALRRPGTGPARPGHHAADRDPVRAEHSGIVEIETDKARDNTHTLAVNHRSTHEHQLDLPTT
ncbi:hypothetical protein ACFVT6_38815 [Streptomyces sp. NPDC058049]|uniref:hypothetical protein n=1 Tax=Streptomyces sp. NPDC058049 TaxID=3346314 RepID=UPI0036EDA27D